MIFLKVKFWDGSERQVSNRKEAIQVIQEEWQDWMTKGDRISWYYSRLIISELPNIAIVITRFGEPTDAGAIIIENDKFF